MQTHQQVLEELGRDIFKEVEGFIVSMSAIDGEVRQRVAQSQAKEEALDKQIRANEEKEAQISNEWLGVLKVREDNIRKINEHLVAQTKVCQRLDQAYVSAPPPSAPQQDLVSESLAAIAESIFAQQNALFCSRN